MLGLVAVVLAASIGAIAGYLTARQQGRHALALAMAAAEKERERQLRQLAVDITKLELERNPDSPYLAAEHVAVLMRLLKQLDVDLETEEGATTGVERFRTVFCASCGQAVFSREKWCPGCGAVVWHDELS